MAGQVTLTYNETHVILLLNGVLVEEFPAKAAMAIGQQMINYGKLVENSEDPEVTIKDQAILNRAGVPVRLSLDPRVHKEANVMAQYDRDLRRSNIDSGIGVKSSESVGAPEIHGSQRTKGA